MSSQLPTVATIRALSRLRTKTLVAAASFTDYNFRNFFVKKTKDEYEELRPQLETLTGEALAAAVLEKKRALGQMRRMSLINQMYAHVPVVVEKEQPAAPVAAAPAATTSAGQ